MSLYEGMNTYTSRLRVYRSAIRPLGTKEFLGGYHLRQLNRMFYTWEAFTVPSKNAKTGLKKNGFSTTFVNYKLTGEAKERFHAYMRESVDDHAKDIVNLLSTGNKFSFSENRDGGFALASVTCREEGSINFDHCITSRSNDWYEALMMCVFKVHELGEDESWTDQAGSEDWG